VIFARRENAWREEDGPASSRGCGTRAALRRGLDEAAQRVALTRLNELFGGTK
jgi:hypothetical protein